MKKISLFRFGFEKMSPLITTSQYLSHFFIHKILFIQLFFVSFIIIKLSERGSTFSHMCVSVCLSVCACVCVTMCLFLCVCVYVCVCVRV